MPFGDRLFFSRLFSILAVAGFLPATTFAQVTFDRLPSNGIIVRAPTCEKIDEAIALLRAYTKRQSDLSDCQLPIATAQTPKRCSAVVTACFPEAIRENFMHTSKLDSPNCFGAALYMAGLAPTLNEANDEEIAFMLLSPLCREVNSYDRMPGDLAMIEKETELLHAYTFISTEYSLTKNGNNKASNYEFLSEKEIHDTYNDFYSGECESCRGKETTPGCRYCMTPINVRYFRCKTIDEYLREAPQIDVKRSYSDLIKQSQLNDCRMQKLLFGTIPSNNASLNLIEDSVLALAQYWNDENQKEKVNLSSNAPRDVVLTRMRLQLDRLVSSFVSATIELNVHDKYHLNSNILGTLSYVDPNFFTNTYMRTMKPSLMVTPAPTPTPEE